MDDNLSPEERVALHLALEIESDILLAMERLERDGDKLKSISKSIIRFHDEKTRK